MIWSHLSEEDREELTSILDNARHPTLRYQVIARICERARMFSRWEDQGEESDDVVDAPPAPGSSVALALQDASAPEERALEGHGVVPDNAELLGDVDAVGDPLGEEGATEDTVPGSQWPQSVARYRLNSPERDRQPITATPEARGPARSRSPCALRSSPYAKSAPTAEAQAPGETPVHPNGLVPSMSELPLFSDGALEREQYGAALQQAQAETQAIKTRLLEALQQQQEVDLAAAEAFRIMREKIIQEESVSAVTDRANANLEANLFLAGSEASAYRTECRELFAHREFLGEAVQQELVRAAEAATSLSAKFAGKEVERAEARSCYQAEAHVVFATRSRLEQEEKA